MSTHLLLEAQNTGFKRSLQIHIFHGNSNSWRPAGSLLLVDSFADRITNRTAYNEHVERYIVVRCTTILLIITILLFSCRQKLMCSWCFTDLVNLVISDWWLSETAAQDTSLRFFVTNIHAISFITLCNDTSRNILESPSTVLDTCIRPLSYAGIWNRVLMEHPVLPTPVETSPISASWIEGRQNVMWMDRLPQFCPHT